MAAGDVNKKTGKPTDLVRHYSEVPAGIPICGTIGKGRYSSNDPSDITCKRCKARRLKINPQAK